MIIPKPRNIVLRDGVFAGDRAAITTSIDAEQLPPGGYRLDVTPERAEIVGGDPAGVFYGEQTLRLLGPDVPALLIEDRPQFRWRGVMLDVARHFMPKEFVLKLLDLMALHKLNVLHLHLTDDQGWRIAIDKYPKLTNAGDFFTKADIREIVSYAAQRFITVVPEIDMPGHMLAAIAAYPELGNGLKPAAIRKEWGISDQVLNVDDTALDFCRDVLAEVMELFPSPFIHCGGDECPKTEWQKSAAAQARIKELGLADEDALQVWFTGQMATFLTKHGRRFVGWDEVLEGSGPAGLSGDVVVMSWRTQVAGMEAARGGLDVVMTPMSHTYLDHYQGLLLTEPVAIGGLTTLEKVYKYRPVRDELDSDAAGHILGAQAQLWTEYVPDPAHAEYMLFPRLCAFAEAVWRDDTVEIEPYQSFLDRLRPHLDRLDVNYRPLD